MPVKDKEISLDRAIDAFMAGFSFIKSFAHPYEVARVGDLKVMRDGPGRKRDPRLQEIIVHGLTPEEAVRQTRAYGPGRHALCTVEETGFDHQALKSMYKQLGYRLIVGQPMFVRELATFTGSAPETVRRVATEADMEVLRTMTNRRQILPEHMVEGEAPLRLYMAVEGGKAVGMVQSVEAVHGCRWVANLWVDPNHRRKGIGTQLMRRMLVDDQRFGAEYSVLLASTAGSYLYPQLGYRQNGLLQIFMPVKAKAG